MIIVSSNIKNNPDLPRPQVRHDLDAVKRLGGIIGWQEIGEASDRADLRARLKSPAWTHHGLSTECPVSLGRRWLSDRGGVELLHGGRAKTSPQRVAVWRVVTCADRPRMQPFAVVNSHWVSGAWSHPGQRNEDWRRLMWHQSHDRMAALVARLRRAGLTVLGTGDYNRTGDWEGFGPGHQWLAHSRYDHIWTVPAPGGVRVRLTGSGTLSTGHLFTDHAAAWARVTLNP